MNVAGSARHRVHAAPVPTWAVASGLTAPIALIGGWTVAALAQPDGFDSLRDTISALADYPARDRWIMTGAIAVTGVCHAITSHGLCPPQSWSRVALVVAGAGTLAVAAIPLGLSGAGHAVAATAAFGALAVWPALAARDGVLPEALTRTRTGRVAIDATSAGFVALLAGLGAGQPAGHVGLSERVLAAGEVLVVASAVLAAARRRWRSARSARA
ncbi:MAG: integral rane protein [Pseudonocardiales bacterium]|nr:integral rane protein [Pseudonocardiales bacterium]